jgi:hypothetical protein
MGTVSLNDAGLPNDLPDAPPWACGGGNECPSRPTACIAGRFAVLYLSGQCEAGTCFWEKQTFDCATIGGTCAAGSKGDGIIDGGIGAEGGTWIATGGCFLRVGSAPVPPATPCSARVGLDASDPCPPPASACADSKYLVYYDDGQCVAGSCVWQVRYFNCGQGCSFGGCNSQGTPPSPN